MRTKLTGLVLASLLLFSAAPAAAGGWKHEYVTNDGNVVTYTENDKTLFYIGCGRGFAIHAKYPATARKEGDADITIATSRGRMTFHGDFEDAEIFHGTDFRQAYLGYLHSDPRVFGKKWNATKVRVLNMLDAHGPITISAEGKSYQLPAIDIAGDWHKALEACKF